MASSIPVGKRCTTVVTGTTGAREVLPDFTLERRVHDDNRAIDGVGEEREQAIDHRHAGDRDEQLRTVAAQARAEAGRGNDQQARAHLRGRSAVVDSDAYGSARASHADGRRSDG